MIKQTESRTVAQALVELMGQRGTDRLFTVPGEAVLEFLAAAGEAGIEPITTRHESGAGFAAIADAQITGKPGLVVVNRSPGAANVAVAIDTLRCDPTPILVVVGAPRRSSSVELGYQSAATEGQLGSVALCLRLDDEERIGEALAQLAAEFELPAPRPVVLIVPQDVWGRPAPGLPARTPPRLDRPRAGQVLGLANRIDAAERPVVILGPQLRQEAAPPLTKRLERFALAAAVPLLAGNKRLDLIDNGSDAYAGDTHQGTHPDTRARLSESDLVVFLGEQAWEVNLAHWHREQTVVTVHPTPLADPSIKADAADVLDELGSHPWTTEGTRRREPWMRGWRSLQQRLSQPPASPRTDGVDLALAMTALSERLSDDAVICLDAGNFGSWVHRYLTLRGSQRLLAVADGSMGSAVPAAMAIANRFPHRQVVAIVGDGGVMMTGNELLMGPRSWRRPSVLVVDNSGYGAIRSQGARMLPGANVAAELRNPDWTAWAQSLGVASSAVSVNAAVRDAIGGLLDAQDGRLVALRVSPDAAHANFDLPR